MSYDELCTDCGQDWTRHTLRIRSGNFALECWRNPSAGSDPFLNLWFEHQTASARIEELRAKHAEEVHRLSETIAKNDATILDLRAKLQSAEARARPLEEACGKIKTTMEAGHQAALSKLQDRYDRLVQELVKDTRTSAESIDSLEKRLLAAYQDCDERLHGRIDRLCRELAAASSPRTGNQDIDSILEDAAVEQRSPETLIEEPEDSDDISPETDPFPDEQGGSEKKSCLVQNCPHDPTHRLHLVFDDGSSESLLCCTMHTLEGREDLLKTLCGLGIVATNDQLEGRFSLLES